MSPLIWILVSVIVYLAGGGITAFVVAKEELRKLQERFADLRLLDRDYSYAMKEGLGCGIIWPVLVPFALVADTFESSLRKSHEKTDPTLKKRRLEEREQKVERMERELGIR